MANYTIQSGTLLEGFEDSTEWTATGGSIANDTSIIKQGTKSLKLTSGSGTNCIATKTVSLDLSRAGLIYFWVYITTLSEVASLQVILSNDTGFTNFYSKTFTGVLHEGWNKIAIGRNQWSSSGSPAWETTFTRLRVRVNANASVTPIVYYDGMYQGYWSRPKCVFYFDDGWDSQYSVAYDYMKKFNLKGTIGVIQDRIGTANYMTLANLQALYNDGWDLCNHTKTHTNLSTYGTQAEVESDISLCQSYLASNGFTRNDMHKHLAYPNGGYNQTVLNACDNLDVITARTIIERTQANEIDHPYLLTIDNILDTTTLAQAKASVDAAIANGGCNILLFHKIVASPAAQTEWPTADFQALIDYVAGKREQIDVVPFTEWYRGLSYSRRLV